MRRNTRDKKPREFHIFGMGGYKQHEQEDHLGSYPLGSVGAWSFVGLIRSIVGLIESVGGLFVGLTGSVRGSFVGLIGSFRGSCVGLIGSVGGHL